MKGRADYKHSNSGQIFSCEPLLSLYQALRWKKIRIQ